MDTTDVEALFRAHEPRVFRFISRLVGRAESARDLTQEVFVRVAAGRMPALADGEALAWMYRVARNLALDHLRRTGRVTPVFPAEVPRPAAQDVRVEVQRALESLHELDRHVFLLREVAGLGYSEIAATCELTPDAVRSRIHRARLHLRGQLAAPISHRQHAPVTLKPRP